MMPHMKSKEDYLNLIENNPVAIGIECGFKDLTEIHNEWLKLILFSEKDETIQAHRGGYKTSVVALGIALLAVLRPDKSIGFERKTDTAAKEVIKIVTKLLKTDVFKLLVYTLYGIELKLPVENSNEISTNLYISVAGCAQITGFGIDGAITGKHFDYIFTDDIVTLTDRTSRAEREKTKAIYRELQNIKNRSGRIINTGTPWHKDDAFCLMPAPHKYDCYTTGLINREELEKLRKSMTNALFAANYELRHIASEDVIFTEPKFTKQTELIYDGICHIDASYGGRDSTTFTIMKKQLDGKIIAFGKRWEKHIDLCKAEILMLKLIYRAGSIYCESNADKWYLAKDYRASGVNVITYHEKMNKFIKISTHLKGAWTDIEWLDDTDNSYINEVLDYNEQAEHDDSPDSAASLVRILKRETTEVKWGW